MILASAAANSVVPGVLGFLVVAGMGLALFFLLRSMNKQLHKVVPGPRWREGAKANGANGTSANGTRANGALANGTGKPGSRNGEQPAEGEQR